MIVLYGFKGCKPCEEAEQWMNENGIKFVKKGVTSNIDGYPTIEANGNRMVGFGENVKHAILEASKR